MIHDALVGNADAERAIDDVLADLHGGTWDNLDDMSHSNMSDFTNRDGGDIDFHGNHMIGSDVSEDGAEGEGVTHVLSRGARFNDKVVDEDGEAVKKGARSLSSKNRDPRNESYEDDFDRLKEAKENAQTWGETRQEVDEGIAALRFFDNDIDQGMKLRRHLGTKGHVKRLWQVLYKALFVRAKRVKPLKLDANGMDIKKPGLHTQWCDSDDIADMPCHPLSRQMLVMRLDTKNKFLRESITQREQRPKVFHSGEDSKDAFLGANWRVREAGVGQSNLKILPVNFIDKEDDREVGRDTHVSCVSPTNGSKEKCPLYVEDIAWRVFDADQGLFIPSYPSSATAWDDFKRYLVWQNYATGALLGLVFIYIFELPWWCLSGEGTAWQFVGRSGEGSSVYSKITDTQIEALSPFSVSGFTLSTENPLVCPTGIELSGVRVLHPFWSSTMSMVCYCIFILKWAHGLIFRNHFGKYAQLCKKSLFPRMERFCAFFGICEALFYTTLFLCHSYNLAPTNDGTHDVFTRSPYIANVTRWVFSLFNSRITHLCVFGLTFAMPFMTKVTYCVLCTAEEVRKVMAVFMICIIFFAWSTVALFKTCGYDMEQLQPNLANFSDACASFFFMGTTMNYPNETISIFNKHHWTGFVFVSYMMIAALVFTNLMLATVYSEYQARLSEVVKMEQRGRMRSLKTCWELVTGATGDVSGISVGEFRMILDALSEVTSQYRITREMIPVIFEILDEHTDTRLDCFEFYQLCSALHFKIWVVRRDSFLIRWMQPTPHAPFASFWYKCLRSLQRMVLLEKTDAFFNKVLIANAILIICQSGKTFLGFPTDYIFFPDWTVPADWIFSFIYMVEITLKLSCVSWGEFWDSHMINRFDFVVSVTLFISSSLTLYLHYFESSKEELKQAIEAAKDKHIPLGSLVGESDGVSLKTLKHHFFSGDNHANISALLQISKDLSFLRVLRLFRILVKTQEFQRLFVCISRMILACEDIMCLLLVSMFFFVSIGQLVWGGKLGQTSKEDFARTYEGVSPDYGVQTSNGEPWSYDPSTRAFNFNDVFMGMFTMLSLFFNNGLSDLVNAQNIAVWWPWPLSIILEGTIGTGLSFQVVVWFMQSTFMFNLYVAFSIDSLRAIDVTGSSMSRYTTQNFKELQKRLFEKGFILYLGFALHVRL